MAGADFLDTNVLVYAYDPQDAKKHLCAQQWLSKIANGNVAISAQVMGEFCATLIHKYKVHESVVAVAVDALAEIPMVSTDAAIIRRALDARRQYGIHFHDSLVVAAAERAGCSRLITEDLNDGQVYFGVTVHNPFAGL